MVRVQSVQGEGFRGIRYSELLMGFGFGQNRLAGRTSCADRNRYYTGWQDKRSEWLKVKRLDFFWYNTNYRETRAGTEGQCRFTVCLASWPWPGGFDSWGSAGVDHRGPPWVVCPDPLDRELWKNVVYWLQLNTLLNIIHTIYYLGSFNYNTETINSGDVWPFSG